MAWTSTLAFSIGGLVGAGSGFWANRAAQRIRPVPLSGAAAALLPVLGAVIGVVVAARAVTAWTAMAWLVLLAVALPLSAIDAMTCRLPDRVLLPAIPVCAAMLALAAASAGDYGPLWRALMAGAFVFAGFTALALAAPGQLGFGDCKSAALCALPLGYLGWRQVVLGVLLAFAAAAIYLAAARTVRHVDAPKVIAFGPFLFAGALATVLAA